MKIQKLEQREELFRRIVIGADLLVLLSSFISWDCFLILLALTWYCRSIFAAGYTSQVVDEWENGSVGHGLRYLYKGLAVLPFIALAIFGIFEIECVSAFYAGVKKFGLWYLFIGILCFEVAYDLQNALIESYRCRKKR